MRLTGTKTRPKTQSRQLVDEHVIPHAYSKAGNCPLVLSLKCCVSPARTGSCHPDRPAADDALITNPVLPLTQSSGGTRPI